MNRPAASSTKVSARMKTVRRSNTSAESLIATALVNANVAFESSARVPGHRTVPDIVIPDRNIAIFIDGCFWHGCPSHRTTPKSNSAWWAAKLTANLARDNRSRRRLRNDGWHVLRIWEHVDPAKAVLRILRFIRKVEKP